MRRRGYTHHVKIGPATLLLQPGRASRGTQRVPEGGWVLVLPPKESRIYARMLHLAGCSAMPANR
jgi:hypothetical protein